MTVKKRRSLRLSSRFLSKWNGRKPSPEHSAEPNRGEAIANRFVESTRKKDRTKVWLRESQVVVPSQRNGVSDHSTFIVESNIHSTTYYAYFLLISILLHLFLLSLDRWGLTISHAPARKHVSINVTLPGQRPSPAPKSTPQESARPALIPHIRDILDNAHRMARERGEQLEQPKQLDRRHTNFNPEITRAPTARQEQIETYRTSAESHHAFIPTGDGKTSCLLEVRKANSLKFSFDLGEMYSRGCVARPKDKTAEVRAGPYGLGAAVRW